METVIIIIMVAMMIGVFLPELPGLLYELVSPKQKALKAKRRAEIDDAKALQEAKRLAHTTRERERDLGFDMLTQCEDAECRQCYPRDRCSICQAELPNHARHCEHNALRQIEQKTKEQRERETQSKADKKKADMAMKRVAARRDLLVWPSWIPEDASCNIAENAESSEIAVEYTWVEDGKTVKYRKTVTLPTS